MTVIYLHYLSIQVWFKNRRAKHRKKQRGSRLRYQDGGSEGVKQGSTSSRQQGEGSESTGADGLQHACAVSDEDDDSNDVTDSVNPASDTVADDLDIDIEADGKIDRSTVVDGEAHLSGRKQNGKADPSIE